MSELFPRGVRCTAVGVAYNLTASLLGGTAPLVATYLISRTQYDLTPAFYAMLALVPFLGLVLTLLVQLLPVAFVFRVRANHEQALLLFLLLAMLGTERARRRPAWRSPAPTSTPPRAARSRSRRCRSTSPITPRCPTGAPGQKRSRARAG